MRCMGYSVLKRCLLRRISPSLRSTWKRNSPAGLRGSLDAAVSPPGWRIPEQPQGGTQTLGPSEVLERRLNSKPGAPRPGRRRREGGGGSCSGLGPSSLAPSKITTPLPRSIPAIKPGSLIASTPGPSGPSFFPHLPRDKVTGDVPKVALAALGDPAMSRPGSACPVPPRGPQSTAEEHRRHPGSSSRATFVATLQRKGCRREPSLRSPQSQALKAAPPGKHRRGYPPPSL